MDVLCDHSALPGGPRCADPVAATVLDADRKHVLHGFAPLRRQAEPGPIFRSAAGLHLTDVQGNDWLDACAGLANVSLGYAFDNWTQLKTNCFNLSD